MEIELNNNQVEQDSSNRPDWIAKTPRVFGQQSRLERIGVAWNREDGGIGIRLVGKQVIEDDIYLYPNDPSDQV